MKTLNGAQTIQNLTNQTQQEIPGLHLIRLFMWKLPFSAFVEVLNGTRPSIRPQAGTGGFLPATGWLWKLNLQDTSEVKRENAV